MEAIFCAKWLSVKKLLSACSSSSFLRRSRSRLGVRKPMFQLLACTMLISRLARAISRKILVCSALTPSTLSCSSSTFAGFISSSMRWKSSLILMLRRTVLIRLSSPIEQVASFSSCVMCPCMPYSCSSHRRARRYTSVKLSLKRLSRCSIAARLAAHSSRRTRLPSISYRIPFSWYLHCVICPSAAVRFWVSWASRASRRAGSMLEASWKSRMPVATFLSTFSRYASTVSQFIFSSILDLKSVSFQFSFVSTSRMRSLSSNALSSTRCVISMAVLLVSPRTSSSCSCRLPAFSLSCMVSSPSTPVMRDSRRFWPANSIESASLIWFSLREKREALRRSLLYSQALLSSRVFRSLTILGSEWMPALMRAMVSVS